MSKAVAKRATAAPAPAPQQAGDIASVSGETAALLSMIEHAARDPTVDIDKMERLFNMKERIEQRAAEAAFNSSMAAAQEKMPAVIRNKENKHTRSTYADLYAIADAALPVAHEHGFGLSFSECQATAPGCMGIACEVTHSSGHSKRYTYNIPLDKAGSQGTVNKTDVQAYGSTFTYGRRYATCGVFNVAITDSDGNPPPAEAAPTITEDQQIELREILLSLDRDEKRFCTYFGFERLAAIPAADFEKAKRAASAQPKGKS